MQLAPARGTVASLLGQLSACRLKRGFAAVNGARGQLPDHRSYQVSFCKCREVLGFAPEWTPARGAQEIMDALQEGRTSADPRTLTVSWYKTLLEWHDRLAGIAQRGRIL